MDIIKNFTNILNEIKKYSNSKTQIIAVSKTFDINYVRSLVDYGHLDFGENRVNEAILKWSNEIKKKSDLRIHLIGKLQSNKIKDAIKTFSYIHSLDSKKLAILLDEEQKKQSISVKYFIQVNIGNEEQKSGIAIDDLEDFVNFCKLKTKLNIIGLMCIPPINSSSDFYFKKLKDLAKKNNFYELSMGMSNDYINAIENGATFIRIGSGIFGARTN
ncbi:MAG: YggS family pyridoxal phosphate-dependent enzyme [Pelagibacteraceae bacterium]|nr:YggS family pyridoxal phosphate-dependent enzyme [Pelagibacteraceae bacterium]PHX88638.1 MAG: YggS family pyridoxal phosphate-dependent enzyme [Pelagibacteraceae bacterium]